MRVSHHVKRSVCLLLSLLLLAQGMTLGAAAVGTDSVPAGTSVLEIDKRNFHICSKDSMFSWNFFLPADFNHIFI